MSSTDFTVFASADFNPSEYANAILAGEPYPAATDPKSQSAVPGKPVQEPPAKEDISEAISKLIHGIDDVTKQIKKLVRPIEPLRRVSHCYLGIATSRRPSISSSKLERAFWIAHICEIIHHGTGQIP